jgi:predicted ferric reductase
MGKLLYVIVVLLIIGWAIGFLGYNSIGIIHILLVIAVILTIFKAFRGTKII